MFNLHPLYNVVPGEKMVTTQKNVGRWLDIQLGTQEQSQLLNLLKEQRGEDPITVINKGGIKGDKEMVQELQLMLKA